jgi:phosphatidylserine/phosphatidylglycerophosphate/cardiolipin synthase-like enzyme
MDPRSRNLNTEIVSIIESKELNRYETIVFEDMSSLENAYTLELQTDEDNETQIVWKTKENGKIVKYFNDGNSGWWLRMKKNILQTLPIKELL